MLHVSTRAKLPLAVASSVLLASCGAAGESGSPSLASPSDSSRERELIEPGVMLSSASRYGDLIWTAGHLPEGVTSDASIEEQTEQALDNLERTLELAGAGFDTLLKTNVYLLDWDDWEAFNATYEDRIGTQYLAPPRTTVDVDELFGGYRIEIEMVAYTRP